MEESKFLKAARVARKENNVEDAKRYYEMVKMEDPNNAEAKFFYEIYRLWSGKKGECYNNFISLCQVVPTSIRMLAESEMSGSEKVDVLTDMFEETKALPLKIERILMELNNDGTHTIQLRSSGEKGILMFYEFGDSIEKYFSGNEDATKIAVEAWKAGVARQQQLSRLGVDKTFPEKYTTKIQKHDPAYTMPKKAGCLQFYTR